MAFNIFLSTQKRLHILDEKTIRLGYFSLIVRPPFIIIRLLSLEQITHDQCCRGVKH